jgi:hypothetical protein
MHTVLPTNQSPGHDCTREDRRCTPSSLPLSRFTVIFVHSIVLPLSRFTVILALSETVVFIGKITRSPKMTSPPMLQGLFRVLRFLVQQETVARCEQNDLSFRIRRSTVEKIASNFHAHCSPSNDNNVFRGVT